VGGRDHSIKCPDCGYQKGGLDNLLCGCDEYRHALALGHPRIDKAMGRRLKRRLDRLLHEGDRPAAYDIINAWIKAENKR